MFRSIACEQLAQQNDWLPWMTCVAESTIGASQWAQRVATSVMSNYLHGVRLSGQDACRLARSLLACSVLVGGGLMAVDYYGLLWWMALGAGSGLLLWRFLGGSGYGIYVYFALGALGAVIVAAALALLG